MSTDHLKPFQFQPGKTGNAGGRPKGLERSAREAMKLREYTAKNGQAYKGIDAAIHCLIDMFFDEKVTPRERIAAFKEWCDRGFGKAKQFVEVTDGAPASADGRSTEDMTESEVREALDAIGTLKRLGGLAPTNDDPTEH